MRFETCHLKANASIDLFRAYKKYEKNRMVCEPAVCAHSLWSLWVAARVERVLRREHARNTRMRTHTPRGRVQEGKGSRGFE